MDNQQPNYEPNYLRKWSWGHTSWAWKRPVCTLLSFMSAIWRGEPTNFNNTATTQIFANKLDVCHTQKPGRSVKTLFLKRLQTKISHPSSNSWNRAFLWWALLIHTSFFHVAQRGLVFRHSLPAPKKLSRKNHSDYIFSLKNEKWLSNYDHPTQQVGWNLPKTLALPAETSTLKGTILTSPQGWVAFRLETKIRFQLVTRFMHISSAGFAR